MAPPSALLWRHLRVHQIYGANTDVGKTIFSTILCTAASQLHRHERTAFLKPVSTGPEDEADSKCVDPLLANNNILQYDVACSPHIAAKLSGQAIPSDGAVRAAIYEHAADRAALGPGWLFIETAGGVHSPGPSGTSQADLYAPLRAPVVLIGDSKLGGISQTISAFESLKIRGQDVEAVLLFRDAKYDNHLYLKDYFHTHGGVPVETAPTPPLKNDDSRQERNSMTGYYETASSEDGIRNIIKKLDKRGRDRIRRLETMSRDAKESIWYPFTQHDLLPRDRISAIDSAYGDHFQVFIDSPPNKSPSPTSAAAAVADERPLLQPAFDGSASWWTQGLGHGNPRLALSAAYAAGRYGHVMFAEAVHEPALALAETLLKGMGNPRLSRVFYSDNGSTGCEVAVKMALRASRKRYGWGADESVGILGLKGSYHGDTMGAMDCSEPSVFNEKVEWYEGKGFWFDYPTVQCVNGRWLIDMPETLQRELGSGADFDSLGDVFDLETRAGSDLFGKYKGFVQATLERLRSEGRKFGALMLEPVVLGAGGMIFADPLFQRALIDVVRSHPQLFGNTTDSPTSIDQKHSWKGLPVVFDEVFVGLYRLGRFAASSFLDVHPDISVHAKLLTGGLIPLCTTLASESVFEAFASDDKSDALLHGHSYTAHAVGCQVALDSLHEMQAMDARGDWAWAKENGWAPSTPTPTPNAIEDITKTSSSATQSSQGIASQHVWSVWSRDFVDRLSRQTTRVSGVWALGSVLSISMRGEDGAGYKSRAAAQLQADLREGTGYWNAHTRVLGNVLYIMAGQKTEQEAVREVQELVVATLGA